MTRGFVTMATGKEQYYAIAKNLLLSYRHFTDDPMPFAIICDKENEYTEAFDDVIMLEHPFFSYLDKLHLPRLAPYDETIFIDADCLAYRDLNDFWDLFAGQADFSAFGESFPVDYPYAWFETEGMGEYADKIEFIPDFIGGVYFIRKSEKLTSFSETCFQILESYSELTFRRFEHPVDEPIFALAMAVYGFRTTPNNHAPICFYPHATYFEADIRFGKVFYTSRYEGDGIEHVRAHMVHWGSGNTRRPEYLRQAAGLKVVTGTMTRFGAWLEMVGLKTYFGARRLASRILRRVGLRR